ncbi:hypothetical protein EW145_g2891 [Phellinidium pouzarii]|uniref:Cytochrome P450 n=1 Tax=Phellinidium pouzarii TaxID=167371 RepID=A0A4S4L930_9AGAM|nr:hypothetical protein EW145_g2891 [Phellinidium pouzarii]
MYVLLSAALLFLYILKRVLEVLRARSDFTDRLPHRFTSIQPLSTPAALLPRSPFYRTLGFNWHEHQSLYDNAPLKTLTITPILFGQTFMYTKNVQAFYQSHSLTSAFYKPANSNPALRMLGENVASAEGDIWKRHRRITAPAFNHSTYRNVWDTTARVYADSIDKEGWSNVEETPVVNFNTVTHKVALFLIAIVGFGLPMTWIDPPRDENGKLSVQAMIFDVATYIQERSMIPKWAYKLGIKKLDQIDEAYTRFEEFMHEYIAERETELKNALAMEGASESSVAENINNIFGRLVNARLSEGKLGMTYEEIIGNCFVFTFAGHETTANTLAATLGLLALYQDEQEWVYQSIKSALGDREPTFEDFDNLDGVLACFIEGSRLYPGAYLVVRRASKDTALDLPRRDNAEIVERIPVKEGTTLILDISSMNYDSDTFPDPEAFTPRRWSKSASLPTSMLDGFIGFSYGPRVCIGHKFAKVEGVAFLTLLLRDWRIEAVMNDGESRGDWRRRVLTPNFGQALLIGEVPLKLVRRTHRYVVLASLVASAQTGDFAPSG